MKADEKTEKTCAACARVLPLSAFHSKGGRRFESKCRLCHNEKIRRRRKERAEPVWSISSLPVRESWLEFERGDFLNNLFVLVKDSGFLGSNTVPENVDQILKRKSGVDALLGLEGKDA